MMGKEHWVQGETILLPHISFLTFPLFNCPLKSYYFDRDDQALHNFAKFFHKQSHEEREHAEKLMKLQNQRGGRIFLQDIRVCDQYPGFYQLFLFTSVIKSLVVFLAKEALLYRNTPVYCVAIILSFMEQGTCCLLPTIHIFANKACRQGYNEINQCAALSCWWISTY